MDSKEVTMPVETLFLVGLCAAVALGFGWTGTEAVRITLAGVCSQKPSRGWRACLPLTGRWLRYFLMALVLPASLLLLLAGIGFSLLFVGGLLSTVVPRAG
jgi:hypothetical protein